MSPRGLIGVAVLAAGCGGSQPSAAKPEPAPDWEVLPERAPRREEPRPAPRAEPSPLPAVLLAGEGGGAGDELGHALVLAGDLLVAGAPGHSVGGAAAGAVHLFERRGDRWVEIDKLVSSTPVRGGRFGHAIALTPGGWLLVGAPGEEDGWGKVYVFHHAAAGKGKAERWQLYGALRGVVDSGPAGEVRVSGFGQVLSATDDLLAVGAPDGPRLGGKHSVRGDIPGALVTFQRRDKAWLLAGHAIGVLPGFAAALVISGDRIAVDDGGAVALYGPAAGKPLSRLAETGAPRLAAGGTAIASLAGGLGSQRAARFSLLERSATGLVRGPSLTTALADASGAQLAFDGERALAAGKTSLGPAAVLLHKDPAGAWAACPPFTAIHQATTDLPVEDATLRELGRSAAIDGQTLAVGAVLSDDRGVVYVFATAEVLAACPR